MTDTQTTEAAAATAGGLSTLPEWPVRSIAILATLGDGEPHAIPVSAPIRAGERRILLNLHRTRDSLQRLRERPRVALTILAAENLAFTARGPAHIIQEPMSTAPDYVAIAIDVEQIDDHRQPAFQVHAGPDRRWLTRPNETPSDSASVRSPSWQQADRAVAGLPTRVLRAQVALGSPRRGGDSRSAGVDR